MTAALECFNHLNKWNQKTIQPTLYKRIMCYIYHDHHHQAFLICCSDSCSTFLSHYCFPTLLLSKLIYATNICDLVYNGFVSLAVTFDVPYIILFYLLSQVWKSIEHLVLQSVKGVKYRKETYLCNCQILTDKILSFLYTLRYWAYTIKSIKI